MTAATMLAMGYRPYAELPAEYKDGRLVLLMGADGCSYPMRWNARGFNIIFSRSKVGIWELDGGGLTWTDEDPDGAPEWWKLPEAEHHREVVWCYFCLRSEIHAMLTEFGGGRFKCRDCTRQAFDLLGKPRGLA